MLEKQQIKYSARHVQSVILILVFLITTIGLILDGNPLFLIASPVFIFMTLFVTRGYILAFKGLVINNAGLYVNNKLYRWEDMAKVSVSDHSETPIYGGSVWALSMSLVSGRKVRVNLQSFYKIKNYTELRDAVKRFKNQEAH